MALAMSDPRQLLYGRRGPHGHSQARKAMSSRRAKASQMRDFTASARKPYFEIDKQYDLMVRLRDKETLSSAYDALSRIAPDLSGRDLGQWFLALPVSRSGGGEYDESVAALLPDLLEADIEPFTAALFYSAHRRFRSGWRPSSRLRYPSASVICQYLNAVGRTDCGYFFIEGFKPEEAREWASLNAWEAAIWRKMQVGVDEAMGWTEIGLGPRLASYWRRDMDFSESGAWIEVGIAQPAQAADLRQMGYRPEQIEQLQGYGLNLSSGLSKAALTLKEIGLAPVDIAPWAAEGFSLSDYLPPRTIEQEISGDKEITELEYIVGFHLDGLTPAEAMEKKQAGELPQSLFSAGSFKQAA